MPEQKKFNTNQKRIREIDINPPILYGKTEEGIKRLVPSSIVTDSSKHNNQSITKGVYASGYRRIITLDSLSTSLKVFKLNSIFERIIVPQSQKDKEVIIMGFTYSEREQRIGATLKDVSLIFWDKQDQFQFQKCFTISAFVSDYQTNIWYLNSTQQWITTDKTNAINIWDLEKEKLSKQIISREITASINDIVEITHIKFVAISSLDKKVTVWDFDKVKIPYTKLTIKESIVFTIELGHTGIHHLLYSYQYQCLITSGFENTINVFSINAQYLDYDAVGKLIGHSSMVTAIQIIEKTPMIVSADDMGNIKIWDIRSLKCLQTINIGCKTSITHILNVPDKNMICLLGTRVNFISFDNSLVQRAHEDVFPIKVEFNTMKQEMAICTRKDMRFLRMKDGKITKIFTGLLQNQDDEIATCSSINQYKNFILGDHRGGLALYSYNNGEKIKDLVGHQSEVSQLKIDFPNKLIISSSWDSSIIIQIDTPQKAEIKRIIKNAHFKKEINQMEVSLYHNIIVTGSSGRKIFIWDYEFVKLIACIEIDKGTEPTGFAIINGYRLLIITTNSGMIYVLKFNIKEFKAQFEVIGSFNLNSYIIGENEKKSTIDIIQTQMSDDYDEDKTEILSYKQNSQLRRDSSANNTQTVHSNASSIHQNISTLNKNIFPNNQLSSAQNNIDSVQNSPANFQSNPSTFNKNQQSTFAQDKKKKAPTKSIPNIKVGFSLQTNDKALSQQGNTEKSNIQTPLGQQQNQKSIFRQTNDSQFNQSDTFTRQQRKISVSPQNNLDQSNDSSTYEADLPQEWPTKILTEIQADEDSKILKNCLLFISTNKGNVFIFNIDAFILSEEVKMSDHTTQRVNYNPLRQCAEDFNSQIDQISKESVKIPQIISQNKKFYSLKEKKVVKVRQFCAHRDHLTSFQFIEINNKCILTSSLDQYVRIWTLKGDLMGNLNVNHPLPIQWNMMFDIHEKVKKRVFYALKILDIMLSKHRADQQLRKIMQIDSFINNLLPPNKEQINLNLSQVKDIHISNLKDQTKGVTFMREEYSPRDIKYDEIKQLFEKELRGTSLKQMEANKRLLLAQQQADEHYKVPEIDIHAKRRKHEEQEMLQFLAPNWRNRMIQRQMDNDHSKNSYLLGKKLDQKIREKYKNQGKTRFSIVNQQGETITIQEEQASTLNQQRNSQVGNMLNTPKLENKRTNSKQSNQVTLSPKKMDDQTRSKQVKTISMIKSQILLKKLNQDLSSNQFIQIIEKDETPNKKQKGSRINLQFNFDTTGSTVDYQQQQYQEKEKKEKKQQKKKKNNRYRSLDYLEYASEKNYLDESILHLNQTLIGQQSTINNVNNSSLNNSILKNNSTINATYQQGSQVLPTDSMNSSIINLQSSMMSKNANNSTTIMATERSSLLSNSVSANNLQKAKVQLFMKNINSKLRQSRYQTEKVIMDKYEKQNQPSKQINSYNETEILNIAGQNDKNILNSIVSEALQGGDSALDNIEYKINVQSSYQKKLNPLSLIKPLQIQAKSILESLRDGTQIQVPLTDRPSNYTSQKQFQLKLPQIQQGGIFRSENEQQLPSSIRSSRLNKRYQTNN